MPATLTLSNLAVSFGAHHLFHGLTQTIGPGTTLGIVGRNGAGKSTLLRAIAGQLTPEAGTIAFSPTAATVGYLPQEAPRTAETLREFVRRRTGIGPAELAMERAAESFSDDDGSSYTLALDQWLSLGGGELDSKLPRRCVHGSGLMWTWIARSARFRAGRPLGRAWPLFCARTSMCCCWTSPPTISMPPGLPS